MTAGGGETPARIGHYVIEGPLGAGGMGEVFAAFDPKLERRVAIKLIGGGKSGDAAARSRMLREARSASALKHPGIVTVHEIGEDDGRTYIAMELVEGETFAQLLTRRGPIPLAEALALVAKVADAVDAAHQAGILHRDIKCANLMIDGRGEVRVLDFGLSKRIGAPPPTPVPGTAPAQTEAGIDPAAPTAVPVDPPTPAPGPDAPITAYGARMGTPGYAAPELLDGEEANRTSDVYSLAVVLYELVCGRRPYDAGSWHELRRDMRDRRFTPPSEVGPAGVPARLDEVVHRALAPRRSDRFASAAALVAAARAAAPAAAPSRRRQLAVGGALVVVVGAAAAAWLATRPADRGGADASAPVAAPAPPPASATLADLSTLRQLTDAYGCAYTPAFADDDTIVYDHTVKDDVDLYRVDRRGTRRRLTSAPAWEWRAAPGRRAGEVLYLATDPNGKHGIGPSIRFVDAASGRETGAHDISTRSAAVAGGRLYYVGRNPPEIRRLVDQAEEVLLPVPSDLSPYVLSAAPGGQRLALMSSSAPMGNRLCSIDLATRALTRLDARKPTNAQPAFGADGRTLYYASRRGIRRIDVVSGRDEEVVPDVLAYGGVAVAPAGDLLVWSSCDVKGPVLDLSVTPPRPFLDGEVAYDTTLGPDGTVAYTRHSDGTLILVAADGRRRQATNEVLGTITAPSIAPDGRRVAFSVRGPSSGLFVMGLHADASPEQLTQDRSDRYPIWVDADRIGFTRTDDRGLLVPYMIAADGGAAERIGSRSGMVMAVLRRTGEVLLAPQEVTRTWWWNPVSHRERPGPSPAIAGVKVLGLTPSPDGAWVALRAGSSGQLIYRMRLDPPGPPEKVFEATAEHLVRDVAITAAGHVLAAPRSYLGNLHSVAAGRGRRF